MDEMLRGVISPNLEFYNTEHVAGNYYPINRLQL